MSFVLASALLFLSACGGAELTINPPKIDKSASQEYSSFLAQAKKHHRQLNLSNLTLTFTDYDLTDKPRVVGICTSGYGYKDIVLETRFWEDAGPISREALVWHELGHCVLGLKHNDTLDKETGCPISIMNSMLPPIPCLEDLHEHYSKELFQE